MNRPFTVVGLGDSVCYGIGDLGADWLGPSWVGRFAHSVQADRLVNLATPGQRAADVARIQLPAALALGPSIALLSVGGNDLLRADFNPVSLWQHTTTVVAGLAASGATILVLGLPQTHAHDFLPAPVRRAMNERADLVNTALLGAVRAATVRLRLANGALGYYIDLWNDPNAANPGHWHIDRMHPSPSGHDYLARIACEVTRLHRTGSGLPTDGSSAKPPATWWLLRHGTPWLLRRSVDLIPQAMVSLAFHKRQYQRMRHRLHTAIEADLGRHGIADRPPSTTNSCPVMNEEASLAKNTAA